MREAITTTSFGREVMSIIAGCYSTKVSVNQQHANPSMSFLHFSVTVFVVFFVAQRQKREGENIKFLFFSSY